MGKLDARLFSAIQEKETALACSLVEQLGDVNYQNTSRHTALHSSVQYNDLDVASHLLNRGGNPMLMPKTLIHANRHECALLMAMKMGRSHEAMQVLLLRALQCTLFGEVPGSPPKWTPYESRKIALLPHYAILWGTPKTFYAAIEHDGNAIPHSVDDTTPFMALLRNLVTFETDILTCREKMEDAWQIISRHPEILWDRYHAANLTHDRPIFCTLKQCTTLGMVMCETLPNRIARHTVDVARNMHYDLLLQERMARDAIVVDFFENDAMPRLWGLMLQQMRIAMGMATHTRLGNQLSCWVCILGPDEMNMVFDVLQKSLTLAEKTFMVC